MLTILFMMMVFIAVAVIVAIIAGIIAISPVILVLFALPFIDIAVLKAIFKRKNKK